MENLERIQVWPDLEKQLPDGRLWRHMAPNVDDHSNQDLIFISNKEHPDPEPNVNVHVWEQVAS